MGQLATTYVAMGDFERAVRLHEEMLLVGRRVAPEYTGAALNRLIASHFDRGEYEAALMYVRIGIAVLDDVGVGPYRVMMTREEAIRILKDMLAPMRDDPGDILRDAPESEEAR